jgi:hypothetical protein
MTLILAFLISARNAKVRGIAVGVHGTVPASVGAPAGSEATLYVAASGRALPVSYRLDRTGSLQFAATFSRWGERLHLTAPSQAIPVTSISL